MVKGLAVTQMQGVEVEGNEGGVERGGGGDAVEEGVKRRRVTDNGRQSLSKVKEGGVGIGGRGLSTPVTKEGGSERGPRGHGGRGGGAEIFVPIMGIAREIRGKVQNIGLRGGRESTRR